MSNQEETDHRGLEVLVRSPCTVPDDMVLQCPGLIWNQLFALSVPCIERECSRDIPRSAVSM